MFNFATLEAEFAKLKTYVADGVQLVEEIPAALNTALGDVKAVEDAISSAKASVEAATAAVAAVAK